MKGGAQFLDRAREGRQEPFQARAGELRHDRFGLGEVERAEIDRHPIEAGLADALETLGDRPLRHAGPAQFRGPERLVDEEAHRRA